MKRDNRVARLERGSRFRDGSRRREYERRRAARQRHPQQQILSFGGGAGEPPRRLALRCRVVVGRGGAGGDLPLRGDSRLSSFFVRRPRFLQSVACEAFRWIERLVLGLKQPARRVDPSGERPGSEPAPATRELGDGDRLVGLATGCAGREPAVERGSVVGFQGRDAIERRAEPLKRRRVGEQRGENRAGGGRREVAGVESLRGELDPEVPQREDRLFRDHLLRGGAAGFVATSGLRRRGEAARRDAERATLRYAIALKEPAEHRVGGVRVARGEDRFGGRESRDDPHLIEAAPPSPCRHALLDRRRARGSGHRLGVVSALNRLGDDAQIVVGHPAEDRFFEQARSGWIARGERELGARERRQARQRVVVASLQRQRSLKVGSRFGGVAGRGGREPPPQLGPRESPMIRRPQAATRERVDERSLQAIVPRQRSEQRTSAADHPGD